MNLAGLSKVTTETWYGIETYEHGAWFDRGEAFRNLRDAEAEAQRILDFWPESERPEGVDIPIRLYVRTTLAFYPTSRQEA